MNAAVVLALLAALAGSAGGAPTPEEERLFAEGLRAFEAGHPSEAEKLWKAGYDVRRDPAFLIRIAEAQEKTGASPEAAESYRRYLREAPDAADRAEIEQRLSRLNPGIVPPRPLPSPGDVPREFGSGPAGQTPPALPPAPVATPRAPVTPALDSESAGARGEEEPPGWTPLKIVAWSAVAVTVGLLGTSAFYAASAASKQDDINRLIKFRDETTGAPVEYATVASRYQEAMEDGRHNDRVAKATLLAAAATAAVATTLFIIDGTRDAQPAVALVPDRGGLSVFGGWRWRF